MTRREGVAILNLDVYRDTGCNLHPSCLACPLAACKYDEVPVTNRVARSEHRDRIDEACRLYAAGMTTLEVARQMGLERRTVARYRQIGREGR